MTIAILIGIYLVLGISDAVQFKTEFPDHNRIELFFAVTLTPAVKIFILVKNNILPAIVLAILLYIIFR